MSQTYLTMRITGKRQGKIAGEFKSKGKGPISVSWFSWAGEIPTDGATGQPRGRRQYATFDILKETDASSTALWAAFATNEELNEVVLEARKSGGKAEVMFMSIKLERARVQSIRQYSQSADQADKPPSYFDEVKFVFQKVEFSHSSQQSDGSGAGSSLFADELQMESP